MAAASLRSSQRSNEFCNARLHLLVRKSRYSAKHISWWHFEISLFTALSCFPQREMSLAPATKTAAHDWYFDTFPVPPSDVPLPSCLAVRAVWQRGCHGGLLRQGLPGQLPLWLRPGRTGGVPGRQEGLLLSTSGKHQQRGTAHSPLPAFCPPPDSDCIVVGSHSLFLHA